MFFRHAAFGLLALVSFSVAAQAAEPAACQFSSRESRGGISDVLQRLVSRAELNDQRGLGGTGVVEIGRAHV